MEFSLDGRSQVCLLPAKNFNQFDSHKAFHKCSSKDAKTLATEIQNALKSLEKGNSSNDSGGDSTFDSSRDSSESRRSDHVEGDVLSNRKEPNTSQTGEKRKHSFSLASAAKKSAMSDGMQESCEKCLVSSKFELSFACKCCICYATLRVLYTKYSFNN